MPFILQGATQRQGCDPPVEIARRFTEPQRYSVVLLDFRTQQVGAWPRLRLVDWAETRDTPHMWTQIVGKIRPHRATASPRRCAESRSVTRVADRSTEVSAELWCGIRGLLARPTVSTSADLPTRRGTPTLAGFPHWF
nr:DUF5996 family protein [Streptomyces sp. GMR22]